MSICIFNLPIFVVIIFNFFACHFEYHVKWHAKVYKVKASQNLAPKCQKKKVQEHDVHVQKEVRAKIDLLNLQKKYAQKLAR